MKNLDKETFFASMEVLYPEAIKKFKAWIDDYKLRVNWNELFNARELQTDTYYENLEAPKYHDLPFEMQIGIFLAFSCTIFKEANPIGVDEAKVLIESCFQAIEEGC